MGASYGYAGTGWVRKARGCWGLDAKVLLQLSFESWLASQCSWDTWLESSSSFAFPCWQLVGEWVTLPCSCFTPGYIFLWAEVVSLDAAGLCLDVWHSGKWALSPSALVEIGPGHGLMATRTAVVPLFSFCPSSAEILFTYNLSAERSLEGVRCTSAQGASLGSGAEGAIQLPDQVAQCVFFCFV